MKTKKEKEPKNYELAIPIGTMSQGMPLHNHNSVVAKNRASLRMKDLVAVHISPYKILISDKNILKAKKYGVIREVFEGPEKIYTSVNMIDFARRILELSFEKDFTDDSFIEPELKKYQEENRIW